jgi:SAM-dependent methyltransferase
VAIAFVSLVGDSRLFVLLLSVHLAGLFVISMACHGELARSRPGPRHLTAFYLAVAAGGALGGVFNGLLAPRLFESVAEYPTALVAACVVWVLISPPAPRPPFSVRDASLWRKALLPLALLVFATVTVHYTRGLNDIWRLVVRSQVAIAFCVVVFAIRRRPALFAWAAAAILFAPILAAQTANTIYAARSFFGVHRVIYDASMRCNVYTNGTTIHGLQSVLPERRHVAGAYYHETGPAGDALRIAKPRRVGIIGLGVGSLATYARAGDEYTYYEIDPVVVDIAEKSGAFSYLADARVRGADVRVLVGDGRLLVQKAADGRYDLIVLDAYSSDVVPVHLITAEAMALYLRKLAPRGLLLLNISSRYLDLGGVVAALAQQAGLASVERLDVIDSASDRTAAHDDGKAVSRWIALARRADDLGLLLGEGWSRLPEVADRAWSDDHADVLSAITW